MRKIYDIIPPDKIKKEKIPSKYSFRGAILRIVSLTLIFTLNWFGLSAIINTRAYLSDTETSSGNIFSATNLDFSLDSPSDFSPEVIPEQEATRNINVQNNGILDFQYKVKVENVNPDDDLCGHLDLADDLSSTSQPLIGFVSDVANFPDKTNWLFTAELSDNTASLQGLVCNFELVFTGWQKDFPELTPGFYDEERIASKITSGQWAVSFGDVVINELMWPGSYFHPTDEWIELRNMTDFEVDLSGWQLTKLTQCGEGHERLMLTIPDGKTIPAHGFFLISNFDKDASRINVDPDLVDEDVYLQDCFLQVKLYKGDWQNPDNLVDTADDGSCIPAAGWHGWFYHLSMERDDIPGNGELSKNWHTCFDIYGTRIYWDIDDMFDCGTPGAPNHSDTSIEAQEAYLQYYVDLERKLIIQGEPEPDFLSEVDEDVEESVEEIESAIIEEQEDEQIEIPVIEVPAAEIPEAEPEPEAVPLEEDTILQTPLIKQEPITLPEAPVIQNDDDNGEGENNVIEPVL